MVQWFYSVGGMLLHKTMMQTFTLDVDVIDACTASFSVGIAFEMSKLRLSFSMPIYVT